VAVAIHVPRQPRAQVSASTATTTVSEAHKMPLRARSLQSVMSTHMGALGQLLWKSDRAEDTVNVPGIDQEAGLVLDLK